MLPTGVSSLFMPKHLLLLLGLATLAWGERIPGRYILELEGDPAPVSAVRMRNSARLARVRAGQDAVRKRLSARTRVLSQTENLSSSLAVEVPEQEAAALAHLPGVRHVYPARTVRLHMDRAVVLTKVLEAWPKVGGEERAGEGMKIAIVDSGIDIEHPGLGAGSFTMPATFPRANRPEDEVQTSAKVIVARSYVSLLPRRDPDITPRDRVGHGTALAMVAAGRRVTGPLATITGVAPRAQLGNYKVFGSPQFNDASSNDVIIKAIDDAVADGMDVINLSLGTDVAPRLEDDPMAQAVERATQAGVIVVVSSGNNGSEFGTVGSPATAPSALTVGASRNGRVFAANVQVDGWEPILAVAGNGRNPAEPLSSPVADIRTIDPTGLGCTPARAESLRGRVALILRGTCTFEEKINNALVGGAVAVLVYATAAEPAPFVMGVGSAGLPALMVSNADGERLRQRLASETVNVTMRFTLSPVATENRMANFSSIGPGIDAAVKPEMVAVGGSVYTATQKLDQNGEMFSEDAFILTSGTSFSAPMVAGAAALLKAARPGLTVGQYRSLLIHTAVPINGINSQPALLQQSGAGQLDVSAAASASLAVSPAILHFGVGGADPRQKLTLQLTNLSGTAQSYSFEVLPSANSHRPLTPAAAIAAAAGATVPVEIAWEGTGLATGAHEGRLRIQASNGTSIDVPYWYSATSTEAALFPFLSQTTTGRRGGTVREAVQFRVTDSAGVPIPTAQPEVIVREGGGVAELVNDNASSPGLWRVNVRLGLTAGANVFRIQAGDKFRDFTVLGQ